MNQFNHETKPLKVLEKFQPETITFNNKHEFQEYLNKHIVAMNALTTQKLNKMFSVKGYHITKIKGEIALRAISGDTSPKQDKRLDVIESHLNKLYQMYNEIANAINGA